MKAAIYHHFCEKIAFETVKDPSPRPMGPLFASKRPASAAATGTVGAGTTQTSKPFPHVPGHEFAGTVVAVGHEVRLELVGQRVTMPFVAGCGDCQNVGAATSRSATTSFNLGFTGWGSFAEYVAVRYANGNLVPLPESMSSVSRRVNGLPPGHRLSCRKCARRRPARRVGRHPRLWRRRPLRRNGRHVHSARA